MNKHTINPAFLARYTIGFLAVVLMAAPLNCSAQDSLEVLTFEDYVKLVKSDHPVTYQAALLEDMADGTERMARGGFDPKIEGDYDQKSFKDQNYWRTYDAALKVPTWYGIELKAGYERANGAFINNSDELPPRGLWNAGISVPLGRGLVLDERRAALQKADIFRDATEQEQILLLNEILFDAALAYLDWQEAYLQRLIATDGVNLAAIRFEGTRGSFFNGDKPAIDTLESLISLQVREQDLIKANENLISARLNLNNYLWREGVTPLEIRDEVRPEFIDIERYAFVVDSLYMFQEQVLASHPELLLYNFKLQDLRVDEKLTKEDLKPDVRVDYNPLLGTTNNQLFDEFDINNFKLGASVSYPLLQRKARGKLQITRVKLEQTAFDQYLKRQELDVKLSTYRNKIEQTDALVDQMTITVQNYERMLEAENRRFQFGESSVFLVNSREVKFLEGRYKLLESTRKLMENKYIYLLFIGDLYNLI